MSLIQRNISYLSKQETIRYFAFVSGLLFSLYRNRHKFPFSPILVILWSSVYGSINGFFTAKSIKLFDRFLDRNVKALISLSLLLMPLLYIRQSQLKIKNCQNKGKLVKEVNNEYKKEDEEDVVEVVIEEEEEEKEEDDDMEQVD